MCVLASGVEGRQHMETIEHVSPGGGHLRRATSAAPSGIQGDESDLIASVRAGDGESMAVLYERYRGPGLRFIGSLMAGAQESEDVLHDAFAKAVGAIRNGHGPSDVFGPYLSTAIRSVAMTFWNKRVRERPAPDEDLDPGPADDQGLEAVLTVFEQEHVAAAMRSLPERWRTVLWYAEVMGEKPRNIAPILGIEANAVSALLIRAKAGLRTAYQQQSGSKPGSVSGAN